MLFMGFYIHILEEMYWRISCKNNNNIRVDKLQSMLKIIGVF